MPIADVRWTRSDLVDLPDGTMFAQQIEEGTRAGYVQFMRLCVFVSMEIKSKGFHSTKIDLVLHKTPL